MLTRIEGFLERLFQAPASLFGARLQPVTLAKRIERAMDTNKSFSDDGVLVPNHYELHLHPSDYANFESYRSALENDLMHGILARARRERYTLVARPMVRITADRQVRRGDVKVAANLVDERGARTREDRPFPGGSETMVLRRVDEAAAPAGSRAYLLVRTGSAQPVQFELGGPLISIGRASDNDVIVDDPQVSRHHCQLKLRHGAYSLSDLGSRNGSSVNGQPVDEIALGPGDLIRIGDTEIEFQVRR